MAPNSQPVGTSRVGMTTRAAAKQRSMQAFAHEPGCKCTWIDQVDKEAFAKEVKDLGKELLAGQGEEDERHLNKIINWAHACTAIGIGLMSVLPWWSMVPALLLSLGITARWTMVAHHTCHGGYDTVGNGNKGGRFNSRRFALGSVWRRLFDWMDWMMPEAWNAEHNMLHHHHTNELIDPDLPQRNFTYLREIDLPYKAKVAIVYVMAAVWKWLYYSPNTYKVIAWRKHRKSVIAKSSDRDAEEKRLNDVESKAMAKQLTILGILTGEAPEWYSSTSLIFTVMLPNLLFRLAVVAIPYAAADLYMSSSGAGVSFPMFKNALITLAIADVLANLHSFLIVVPNHAGDDMYFFKNSCEGMGPNFYIRQIVASVNFRTGGDLNDFLHGWLNYQIEHHAWPRLSMLSYQRAQPRLKAICEKHGVPYVQHSVWTRLQKTVDNAVGATSMINTCEGAF